MDIIVFPKILDFITIILTFASSLFALLMYITLILYKQNKSDTYMALLMLCAALWRFGDGIEFLYAYGNIINIYALLLIMVTTSIIYYWSIPLLYYLGQYYLKGSTGSGKIFLYHCISPVILSSALILYSFNVLIFNKDISKIFLVDSHCESIATIIAGAYLLHTLTSGITILNRETLITKQLIFLIAIIFLLLLGTITAYFLESKFILSLLFFIVLGLIYIYRDFFRYSLSFVQQKAQQQQHKKSYLNNLDIEEIIEKLTKLMVNEKLYTEETLTLNSLAQKLEITPHQLSEIINKHLNKNFYELINSYRIEHACQLLQNDKSINIIDVAYKVGFNSLSSFYSAFKKTQGISPKIYQKNNFKK